MEAVYLKNMKRFLQVLLTMIALVFCSNAVLQWVAFLNLPTELVLIKGRPQKIDFLNPVFNALNLGDQNIVLVNGSIAPRILGSADGGYEFNGVNEGSSKIQVMAFGAVPVKTINLQVVPNETIYPSGLLVGMRLQTDGLLVIETDNVKTDNGLETPGESAGIQQGDFLMGSESTKYLKIDDFVKEIAESKGKYITIKIRRGKQLKDVSLQPVKGTDGVYRAGLWLRDGIAGLGTLTFTEKQTKVFGALGHGVLDVDTNIQLPIRSGKIYEGKILSVKKGKIGSAGEIQGVILEDRIYGNIMINYYQGVFGKMTIVSNQEQFKAYSSIASRYEVKDGPAEIISDVDEIGPQKYQCQISSINTGSALGVKGFVITITDPLLVSKTGGIVQGMSGSPVLQNGKLIGAVTHVMVNDPLKGYGVFIDSMLKTASQIAN